LCDANGSVHLVGAILEETMEVDAGALVSKLRHVSMIYDKLMCKLSHLVMHVGDDSVTFREVEQGQWPLSVDSHHGTFGHTIWIGAYPSDVPIECDCCRVRHSGEGKEAREEALR
jgi:hypothetical protein